MAVDDTARRPERKAAEIHRQLGPIKPPVPVHEIALGLDILEITEQPFDAFEGVLLTRPERDFGIIGINAISSPQRRRFSVAHELGHFLCDWHTPVSDAGFRCTRRDMSAPAGDAVHRQQEAEANLFAIELLAPASLVAPHLRRLPDLENILAMTKAFDISKAAAARRYVQLHTATIAVVFAKDGCFGYIEKSPGFPFLPFERNQHLPLLPSVGQEQSTSEMIEGDAVDWGLARHQASLWVQVLPQENGHSIILLHLEQDADQEG